MHLRDIVISHMDMVARRSKEFFLINFFSWNKIIDEFTLEKEFLLKPDDYHGMQKEIIEVVNWFEWYNYYLSFV